MLRSDCCYAVDAAGGGSCRGWMLPDVSVGAGLDSQAAAGDFVRTVIGGVGFHISALRGALWAKPFGSWERERRSEVTALIVQLSAEIDPEVLGHPGRHVWWGIDQLAEHRRMVHPQGVIAFMAGYLEGWLPDGTIRLD